MKWTFGIITSGNSEHNVASIHRSIISQGINDDYEIIVVGGGKIELDKVSHYEFDESIKQGWITKKKNMIALNSKFENLCLMHDYVTLHSQWYENFEKFGADWDVCMNSIINYDGQRFRDWVTGTRFCKEKEMIYLDYNDHSRTNQMYVSGTYFCVKKSYILDNPLDENLGWGQGEDVEWSERILHLGDCNYRCNPDSKVSLMKLKKNDQWYKKSNNSVRKSWNIENGIKEANYSELKIEELKNLLRYRGLPLGGRKADLVSRLQN